ncbi:unnamed protein product [Closterium sp. Yama58-4]|nr:unnamed protein product [Closterium sp. Yama58-4]
MLTPYCDCSLPCVPASYSLVPSTSLVPLHPFRRSCAHPSACSPNARIYSAPTRVCIKTYARATGTGHALNGCCATVKWCASMHINRSSASLTDLRAIEKDILPRFAVACYSFSLLFIQSLKGLKLAPLPSPPYEVMPRAAQQKMLPIVSEQQQVRGRPDQSGMSAGAATCSGRALVRVARPFCAMGRARRPLKAAGGVEEGNLRRGAMGKSGGAGVAGRLAVMGVVAVLAMVGSDEGLTKGGWAQRCFWRSSGGSRGFPPIMMAHAAPLHPTQWPAVRDMKAQWGSVIPGITNTWVKNADCAQFFSIYCNALGFVTTIDLSETYLSGALPETIGVLNTLQYLYISGSFLSGSLPSTFSKLVNLKVVNANQNDLRGPLPEGIGALTALVQLHVQENRLEGSIPSSFTQLTALTSLDIQKNQISGPLPDALGSVSQLADFRANDNLISGPLPSSITKMTGLGYLELGNNNLSGSLPSDLGTMTSLQSLILSRNAIRGPLPTQWAATKLYRLDISDNHLSGTIPDDVTGLVYLTLLDLSSNRLTGTIPQGLSFSPNLNVLNLRNNLLTGKVLEPVPPKIEAYKLDNNYLSEGFSSPPPCGQGYITYRSNCAATPADGLACGADESQKADPVCFAFCGVSPTDPPCNGHGVCYFDGPSNTPTCLCDDNFVIGEFPGSCVPVAGGKTEQQLTPTAATLTATGDASVNAATLTLTPAQPSKAGSVFLAARVPLFSYQLIGDSCGRELAFSSSFSFTLTRPAASGSEGFAFVVAFDATPPTTPVAGGMGYAGMGARSVAVEFDTSKDAGNSDPDSNHMGINTGGNVTSVVTANMSTSLNDGKPKHVWIEYDPSSSGSLRVFLSSQASPRPTTPLLSARISLCEELAPSPSEYTFAIGFTAASATQPQSHVVSAWTLSTCECTSASILSLVVAAFLLANRFNFPVQPTPDAARGFTFSEAALSLSGINIFFRYASSGSVAAENGNDVYGVPPTASWARPDFTWPVKTQTTCGDCWAYAVVGSVEAALGILANTSAAPVLSVEQLKAAMKVGCSGSTPSQAFQLLLKLAQKGGGLVLDSQWPAEKGKKAAKEGSSSPLCSPLLKPLAKLFGVSCGNGPATPRQLPSGIPISGFESTSFYGWFGLLLAVQRQPVVVHIEASAPTFKNYDGLSKYQDPACFTYNLNHVVLLVGYRLVGKDSRFPHMAPPFWIIRNSWGPDWGDGGHMRMDIQGWDGVCGINSLPGLYPVVRGTSDPCSLAARNDSTGSFFNPCGKFKCTVKGKTNECECNDPRFIQATNADGSRTCAYKDACKAAQRNPCAVGQCVNDGAGSYSCVCPPGFRQGTTVEGTYSCAPGGTSTTYTVLSPNVRCSDVFPVYGLTLAQFQAQNPSVSCADPIPPSTVLKVASPASLTPCSVYYTTQQGDTCEALASYFGTKFQALNPSLDCTANSGLLQPEQAVCVERETKNVGLIPVCSQYYLVQSAETCESIRNVPYPPLKPIDFFRLNPGIKCNRLLPKTDVDGFTGFEACIASSTSYTQGTCPRANAYVVGTGDRCTALQVKYFRGIKGCYKHINGYDCIDKLVKATRVCLPDKVKLQQGVCDN